MKNKIYIKTISIIISLVTLFFSVMFFVVPKNQFSENENRNLAQFPIFTFDRLKSGRFIKDFEGFLVDQFPLRDRFMSIKTGIELSLGKKEINNVYIGSDSYFFDVYNSLKNTETIIKAFNEVTKSVENANVNLMLVPTSLTIYSDKLPANVKSASQLEDIQKIYSSVSCNKIDVYEALMDKREKFNLFYKYDHHWTTYAAYFAYVEYCKNLGIDYLEMDQFNVEKVSSDFKGTTYSKVHKYSVKGDSIHLFYQNNLNIVVDYIDTQETKYSLYTLSYLDKKDKYSLFLDNIHTLTEITNKDIDSTDELVLIKDSFANCMVPFLINHYKKIYVIDPRSYLETMSDFINEHPKVKDVFILYNMGTIDNDTGIRSIY